MVQGVFIKKGSSCLFFVGVRNGIHGQLIRRVNISEVEVQLKSSRENLKYGGNTLHFSILLFTQKPNLAEADSMTSLWIPRRIVKSTGLNFYLYLFVSSFSFDGWNSTIHLLMMINE